MSPESHLQAFSLNPLPINGETSFHLFPRLPKELRLKIWQHFATTAYRTVIHGCQVLSKLLRVNTESRDEALRFYRVHIPCYFVHRSYYWEADHTKWPARTFYFNPEYDFLYLVPGMISHETVVPFFRDLKVLDPRGIGLLNLILDGTKNSVLRQIPLHPVDVQPHLRAAFIDTMSQLQEVFFVSVEHHPIDSILPSDAYFNRSLPIFSGRGGFDRLERDPRPITHDLKRISADVSSVRTRLVRFYETLSRWNISPTRVQYRLLLAFATLMGYQGLSSETAQKLLRQGDEIWRERTSQGLGGPIEPNMELSDKGDSETDVQPVFGFWLLPVDMLPQKMNPDEWPQELDLSENWPELGVIDLCD